MKHITNLLVVITLALCSTALATDIPSTNRITWEGNVGIPGGIPIRTNIYTSLTNSGSSALQSAINACPSNSVVMCYGTFQITNEVAFQSVWGVTVRGNGTNTIFVLDQGARFHFNGLSGSSWFGGGWVNPTIDAGYTRGSTSITVSASLGIKAGDTFIKLYENVDTDIGNQPGLEGGPGPNCLGQWTQVTSKSGNVLGLADPIYWTYKSALSPHLRYPMQGSFAGDNLVRWCGIEDCIITNVYMPPSNISGQINVLMEGAAYCWLKNVVNAHAVGKNFQIDDTYRCEIRDSVIKDSWAPLDTGRGYGINMGDPNSPLASALNTGILIEDCVFDNLRTGLLFGYGDSGNAIGYNYSTDMANETPTQVHPAISIHSAHAMFNLIEGNNIVNVMGDYFHGSSSHQTIFRNNIRVRDNTNIVGNLNCIDLNQTNLWYQVQGNILGYAGLSNQVATLVSPTGDTYYAERATIDTLRFNNRWKIYSVGWISDGDGGSTTTTGQGTFHWDLTVWTTLYASGNYDYLHNAQIWDAGDDHTMRNSYLYSSRPSFIPTTGSTTNWPPVDPFTPTYQSFAQNWYFNSNGMWNANPLGSSPGTPPVTPTGLAAIGGNLSASISWNASSGATAYTLQRSPDNATWATVYHGASTSFGDAPLAVGTYYYQVRAENSFGNSSYSSSVSANVTVNATTGPKIKGHGKLKGKATLR